MQDAIVWSNGIPPAGITHKEDFGNHILSISHREKDGRAELHETKADVMIVQSGEATLVYGGQVIDPQTTAPNEIQGSGIKGGTRIRSQSRRCHPHPYRHTAPVFPRFRQADHIHARKSGRSAQSKSLKTALEHRWGNTCQTCVSPVSWFEFNKLHYSGDAQREPLSPNLQGEAQKLSAGTCDRCE
jgi:hypothetical protein